MHKQRSSYVEIVRWDGPLGKFTYLARMHGTNYGLKNGDILKASVVGNLITVFINDIKKAQVTDDTFKTGNPGNRGVSRLHWLQRGFWIFKFYR